MVAGIMEEKEKKKQEEGEKEAEFITFSEYIDETNKYMDEAADMMEVMLGYIQEGRPYPKTLVNRGWEVWTKLAGFSYPADPEVEETYHGMSNLLLDLILAEKSLKLLSEIEDRKKVFYQTVTPNKPYYAFFAGRV